MCDFYVCNPSLMARASMARDERNAFNSSGIPKPSAQFIAFPNERVLYAKMAGIQRQATKELAARSLIDVGRYRDGWATPTSSGTALFEAWWVKNTDHLEQKTVGFLRRYFAPDHEGSANIVKKKTGLTRAL